jgi:hypothetical protein
MRRAIVLTMLLFSGLLMPVGQAAAADVQLSHYYSAIPPVIGPHPPIWRYNSPPQPPPFLHSKRSGAIWASDACWNHCRASCAWDLNGCVHYNTQGVCILYSAACDRYCQADCRIQGGPFLPIE